MMDKIKLKEEVQDSPLVKAYTKCFLRKLELLNPQGTISEEQFRDKIKNGRNLTQDEKSCFVSKSNSEETAYQFFKCMRYIH